MKETFDENVRNPSLLALASTSRGGRRSDGMRRSNAKEHGLEYVTSGRKYAETSSRLHVAATSSRSRGKRHTTPPLNRSLVGFLGRQGAMRRR